MTTGGPDDPPRNASPEDLFWFAGDGDRVQEQAEPPDEPALPDEQPDADVLLRSGESATQHILTALARRVAGTDSRETDVGDETLATRLVGRVLALLGRPPQTRPQHRAVSSLWLRPEPASSARTWTLRAGVSASAGLKEWLDEHATMDCAATVACAFDEVRAVVGEMVFDRCFGSSERTPQLGRLALSALSAHTPLEQLLRYTRNPVAASSRDQAGRGPVQAGEWYVMSNVLAYRYKHPAGPWRDGDVLFLGEVDGQQMWSGFGMLGTEQQLQRELQRRHHAPRDEDDLRWLASRFPDERAPPLAYTDYAERTDATEAPRLDLSRGLALNARTLAELRARSR